MDFIPKTGDDTMYVTLRFIVWFGYTEFAVMTAAIFTHYVAPEAIGSHFFFASFVFLLVF